VSAVPDVSIRTVDLREDSFVIIASDGVWGPVGDVEAVRVIATALREGGGNPVNAACQKLAELAHQREASDDKTVVVVWFGDLPDAQSVVPSQSTSTASRSVRPRVAAPVSDDMFAGTSSGGRRPKRPAEELDDLDDLFSSYAHDMEQGPWSGGGRRS